MLVKVRCVCAYFIDKCTCVITVCVRLLFVVFLEKKINKIIKGVIKMMPCHDSLTTQTSLFVI